jgi:hypothetical protein
MITLVYCCNSSSYQRHYLSFLGVGVSAGVSTDG